MIRPGGCRRSFTIVEVLLALAITAIVIVAVGYALKGAVQSARTNAHFLETRQRAHNGLNYVLSSIRQAKAIHLFDSAGVEIDPTTCTGSARAAKLRAVKVTDPNNGNELKYSTIDLDTSGGHSYLRVTSEAGTSDPALDSVTSLSFTSSVEKGDGGTWREVTVSMAVRITDPMAPNDVTKARTLNLQATEVARCILKP